MYFFPGIEPYRPWGKLGQGGCRVARQPEKESIPFLPEIKRLAGFLTHFPENLFYTRTLGYLPDKIIFAHGDTTHSDNDIRLGQGQAESIVEQAGIILASPAADSVKTRPLKGRGKHGSDRIVNLAVAPGLARRDKFITCCENENRGSRIDRDRGNPKSRQKADSGRVECLSGRPEDIASLYLLPFTVNKTLLKCKQ